MKHIQKKQSGRPLRIAYGRIFHEANSYAPTTTEKENFTEFHYHEGSELESLLRGDEHELVEILKKAELRGFLSASDRAGSVEVVPLMSAFSIPSGAMSQTCLDWLLNSLTGHLERALEEGPLDGLYLALHGSMRVLDYERPPEAEIIARCRKLVGDDCKIAVSYDLHANLSREIVESADLVEGYRTNPHRDLYRTGKRAGEQLIAALRGHIQPTRAWRKLPVVLGGGMTIDFLNPVRPIFMHIKKLCAGNEVVSAHLFMVHPFTDASDLGWAVQVCTDGNQALADKLADELADMAWKASETPIPELLTAENLVADIRSASLARKTGHVSVVDTADIVGAGATGGNTHLLAALVKDGSDLHVLLPLHDPRAIDDLRGTSLGQTKTVTLRGTEGMKEQPEVTIEVKIECRRETKFGMTLLLRHDELRIAVSEKPPGTVHPQFWKDLGASPWKADAVIQKFFFHYRMFYAASLRKNLAVASAGPSSLDNVRKREFELPVRPNSEVRDWRPFDQKRRVEAIARQS